MIRFKCSRCGKTLKADEELVGRRVKCTRCEAIAIVPDLVTDSNLPRETEPAPATAQVGTAADPSSAENSIQSNSEKLRSASQTDDHRVGVSAVASSAPRVGELEFQAKQKTPKFNRWAIPAIAAVLGLIVASVVAYFVIKNTYAIPKFKAEFESMAEVEFYRRAHGQLEQSRKRLAVMAGAFKAKGSPQGDFSEEHQRLNASIDNYTNNSESLLKQAAMLLAEGKDLHSKSILVETGKEMQSLIVDIENEVGQFNKKTRR